MTKSALGRIPLHGMQLPAMANFTEVAVSIIDFTFFSLSLLAMRNAWFLCISADLQNSMHE